jgi:hypothetical protein
VPEFGSGRPQFPVINPKGWRMAVSDGQPVLVLEVDHPDYPTELRERALAEDEERYGKDPEIRAAVERLKQRFAAIDEQISARLRLILNDPRDLNAVNAAVDAATSELVAYANEEDARLGPTPHRRRRYAYLIRHANEALPGDLGAQLRENGTLDVYAAPFLLMVNLGTKSAHPQVYPGEVAVHLDRLPTRDLPKLGRAITEAQAFAGQADRIGKGGRPKLPDISDEAATPEMVAKLRHWEGWSHRRIAAFVGWLKPDDDWRDEKVRRRVEQRVRRWVRDGEDIIRSLAGPDDDWRKPPAHLRRAIEEERPRV